MARYIEAYCRLCRRTGTKLMLKGREVLYREVRPRAQEYTAGPACDGTGKRRPKVSERGLQLMEKQKAKYTYGTFERQFQPLFRRGLEDAGHHRRQPAGIA